MLVTASWGGADVAVEVDAECRSVAALKRCLQEALPELDVEAVRLEVCGRSVDDEEVLRLGEGSAIDISVTQAALAATSLREEGCAVDFHGFCRVAREDDVRLCKLYLEAGVVWPPGVTNPLHIAVRRDHRELCELFLSSGCASDEKDVHGYTPLHCAVYEGNRQLAKLLLDSRCARDEADNLGCTPLHCAVSMSDTRLCKLLLDSGCAKDLKENEGNTPLHCAVSMSNTELCQLLLDSGCAKQAQNNEGKTPLQCCEEGTTQHKLVISSGCV